ncbi:helix-turn-helix domain-containing protein [Winogradskya consettensis]|uniref:Transcriptional regulator n=1 Tax=Winogradskya consettensis TaxID=113560 RepID=A0A919SPL4_9ACTN|nr:winged helix-turn-helix domain-containing protein [Actinoplanes consettensis]GIM74753.1 transcriptional regulator [Actinoplanes consettensis]
MRREITDPQALRALAHPIRLKLLELLTVDGPASGRALAGRTGESTASVSYHVAQLAKWGLVEPAPDLAHGRERPWRATSRGITWSATGDGSPEFAAASRALREQFVAHRLAVLEAYQRHESTFAPDWQEAAWVGEDIGYLTPAELVEATERIKAVIQSYTDPGRPRQETARQVAFFGYAVPVPEDQPA